MTEKKTVLIVDDEAPLRDAIAFDLKRKGYEVLVAASGHEAFEIVKQGHAIDVVISDIRMPDGDGIELLTKIKQHDPKLPIVIFVTAFSDLTKEEAHAMGAEFIFSKPFDRKQLHAAVERALTPKETLWSKPLGEATTKITLQNPTTLWVGRGGFSFSYEKPPKAGQPIAFDIRTKALPFARLSGTGYCRWIKDSQVGIEINFLDETCRKSFLDYVESSRCVPYIPLGEENDAQKKRYA